jgi:hypothetical protein
VLGFRARFRPFVDERDGSGREASQPRVEE